MNNKHELNKTTLANALQKLPTHEPDEQVWASIAHEMEVAAAEKPLREAIRKLPSYEPSETLWQRIESAWQSPKRLKVWRNRLAVAASICLVAMLAWWLWPTNQAAVEIVYSTETVSQNHFETNWNEDEDAFALLATLCEEQQFICDQPHFQTLQNELEELTEAKETVQAAINRYGEKQRFLQQLARIERERSDVLKAMVREI